jgi:ubiquinone/menaquinone biosynthesis C-methylase UbiE
MRRKNVNKVIHGLLNQNINSFAKTHTFDIHWSENLSQEIPTAKKRIAQKFLKPVLDRIRKATQPLLILDAGCGDGVHAQHIYEKKELVQNFSYCGADISRDALKITSSRVRKHPNFSLFHADISKLPFKDNSFDATFSFGVLAYTEIPGLSFSELYRVTKIDGLIGIWIYPELAGVKGWLFKTVRNFCRLMGPGGTRIVANMLVPFLHFLPTRSKMSLKNATWSQCREIVLVNIAPEQLYFPRASEIEKWFYENNIQIIENDQENPITLWGIKI